MKLNNTIPRVFIVLLLIVLAASCEEDFNTIGVDIIGDENFQSEFTDSLTILSYSRKLVPVQTNGLPVYQLGLYNDPVYGKRTVNFLGQVTLDETDPDFETAAQVDSVVLYIPFFSEQISNNDEEREFRLDSVYGSEPIDIEIYESNYFLRDFDPDTGLEEIQNYYSNQGPVFENFLGEMIYKIEDFNPSSDEIVINDSISLIPGLRAKLPNNFFQRKILRKGGSIELINNNNFRDYFRGLYFKVVPTGDQGNLFYMDLEDASLTIHYSFQTEPINPVEDITVNDTIQRFDRELGLSFNAINVNTYIDEVPSGIMDKITNPDIDNGEENLYIRGGDGILSVVELFGKTDRKKILNGELVDGRNGVSDELDQLRIEKWIINEANLIFYVDKDKVSGGDPEPERIIIYDLKNNTVLVDYGFDITSNLLPINAISEHLGPLERGSDDVGDYYKLRITNHVSNLINQDSTNVPLGVIVSQNVLENTFVDTENTQAPGINGLPASSVVAHEGTVLFGNNAPDPEKRLKLQIYYTKPE